MPACLWWCCVKWSPQFKHKYCSKKFLASSLARGIQTKWTEITYQKTAGKISSKDPSFSSFQNWVTVRVFALTNFEDKSIWPWIYSRIYLLQGNFLFTVFLEWSFRKSLAESLFVKTLHVMRKFSDPSIDPEHGKFRILGTHDPGQNMKRNKIN